MSGNSGLGASHGDRPLLGIQAMLAATFFYTLCDAIGKWVLGEHSVFMLLLIRSVAAGLIILPILYSNGFAQLWRIDRPKIALFRIIAATAETTLFFIAVQYLSLASTLSIYLAAPLLVALLSPWLLGERLTPTKIIGCCGGFLGVLLLLQPGADGVNSAGSIAIAGMIALALTLITARSLKTVEPMVLVGHQIIGTFIIGIVGLCFWQPVTLPSLLDTSLMALVGIAAMVAQFFIAWSMRLAQASVVSPFFYSAMIWALAADALVWQVFPTTVSLIAAVLIIASGLWLSLRAS